jgi:hypothetical protein
MSRTLVALALSLLAFALAYANTLNPKSTHAFVCTPPPEIIPGLRHAIHTRPDTCLASHGVPWPVYQGNGSLNRPRLHPHHETRRQERILAEFFSALLEADDLALLERETKAMGVAYLDTNFSMCRRPMLLRSSVREIMQKYSMPFTPVERKWKPVDDDHML